MKWTVTERPAEIGRGLTVFEINEEGRELYLISAQSSEHCPGYGWTADELRERVRLMAAAPRLAAALRGAVEHMEWSAPQGSDAFLACMEALAILDDHTLAEELA